MRARKHGVRVAIMSALACAIALACPFFGLELIGLGRLLHSEEIRHIFFSIRGPRTITAFLAGGGLAVAGMTYQALFRNPLASPYTLGVAGGASLGAALTIAIGFGESVFGISMVSAGSFTGAVGAMLLVYAFAWSRESNSATLLLAGVVVATVCSGLIMFVHYISPLRHAFQIMRWIMGGIDGTTYGLFCVMAAPLSAYLALSFALMPHLDQFLTGDAIAHARGINVGLSRNVFIVASALAVGAVVSIVGPIGFVGIMAPHACRMIIPGARHRLLGIGSFMLGGAFLTISDTIARTIVPPAEIPVGIITALFGGPFFLGILFRRKTRLHM